MSRFNKSKQPVLPSVLNYEGTPAFPISPKLEMASILLTSFATDNFYRDANSMVMRLGDLIQKEPEFAAKAAIFARNEFGMRSVTHIVATFIAKFIKGEQWTRPFFYNVVRRPDDITEIMSLYLSSYGKPIPNSLKDGMAKAINKFGRYELAKYRADDKQVSMVDIVNLTHPSTTSSVYIGRSVSQMNDNRDALELLVKDELRSTDTWESKLSNAGANDEMKKDAWVELIENNKLGYFALLRNLRNISQQSPEILDKALQQLIDKKRIRDSLVFPFRFLTAKRSVDNNPKIIAAIDDAIEISLSNIPKLPGKTLVAVDNSGSMSWSTRERGSDNSPAEIANLFGAALYKSQDLNTVDVISFGSDAKYIHLNPRDSLVTMCNHLNVNTGATYMHKIFSLMVRERKVYDRVIILSDMQAYGNKQAYDEYNKYCKVLNVNPSLYSVDLQGYGTIQFPEKNVYSIAGFSEKIFSIMALFEEDRDALINTIESVSLEYR